MQTIKRHKLLITGLALILAALLVAAIGPVGSALARSISGQAAGQNDCHGSQGSTQGTGGMMSGMISGMMGNGMGMMSGMMGDVDRHFIEMMIPHHENAIAMADLALQKSRRPEIRTLAADIKRVQQAEIDRMRAWYRQWYGTEVPAVDDAGASSCVMMGNGSGGMMGGAMGNGGMMGGGTSMGTSMGMGMGMRMDLDALAEAADFDKAFIEMMVPHHRMALMMSNMVLAHGEKADLRTLAQTIITGQSAEIEQMQTWYRQWYGTRLP
jgi:uncharacterized protein (DUF305 family)